MRNGLAAGAAIFKWVSMVCATVPGPHGKLASVIAGGFSSAFAAGAAYYLKEERRICDEAIGK
jgi:hypothetical protein